MLLVWYNPDLDIYEKGSHSEFNIRSGASHNQDRFEITHQFEEAEKTNRLAQKLLQSLNLLRTQDRSHREIFA